MRRMIFALCVLACGIASALDAKIDGQRVVFDCPSAGMFRIECQSGNGTEWFTLIDQSATGRFFLGKVGESYNTGLLSVTDRPYRDLWQEMRDAHLEVVELFLK